MKNYVVVENHNDGTLSVMLIEKYREMSKGYEWRYEPISDADTTDEALKIIAHINELGGVSNYLTELMDKYNFHKVVTKERTVVSIVDKFQNGYVWVVQLHALYKIMDEKDSSPEDAVMITLNKNIRLQKPQKGFVSQIGMQLYLAAFFFCNLTKFSKCEPYQIQNPYLG